MTSGTTLANAPIANIGVTGKLEATNKTSFQPKEYTIEPLDYSFKEVSQITDILAEEPRNIKKITRQKPDFAQEKLVTAIRLSNNQISTLASLPSCIEQMKSLSNITWLDLSFNALTTIDSSLLLLSNLKVLYLHANHIDDVAEVEKLSNLSHLFNLTLHGNTMENTKTYRSIVLLFIPRLKHLDFCAITKQDRTVSNTLAKRIQRQQTNAVLE
ncbi:hypothetical protein O5D80_006103 [Batrachochytrium dendrobatidis]|nr:hypothetical protein O5D80_006103 [Batrachochytrium dendrobatidis]